MSMSLVRLASQESHRQLPMPDYLYGILALLSFALLLGILWSFRNTANKVRGEGHTEARDRH